MATSTVTKGSTPKASHSKIIRKLANMEKYQSGLHVTRQYASTTVTCRYTIPKTIRDECASATNNQPLRDAFFAALARTVLDHPALQVGQINEDSRSPAWIELDTIDLHHHVDWQLVNLTDADYEDHLRKTITHHLDTFFDHVDSKPGWRLAVLQRTGGEEENNNGPRTIEVVLAWNHSNFDGTGAKIFHKTLLRHLNRPRTSEDEEDEGTIPWVKPGILKLESVAARYPPRITRLAKFTISKKWALGFGWHNLKPSMFRGPSQYDTPWAPIRLDSLSTKSGTFFIKAAELQGLLKACRAHKTTITGLLTALVVASLAVQSREDGMLNGGRFEGITTNTAMDLRRFLPAKSDKYPWIVPDELLGDIVSVALHEFDANMIQRIRDAAKGASSDNALTILESIDEPMWEVATRTRRDLEDRIKLGLRNEINPMLSLVPDWRAEHRHHATKPRMAGLVVTNLGVLDGGDGNDDGDSWGIDSSRFQLSPVATGQPIHVAAISVKGGDMCVDASWQPGVLPDEVMGPLVANMESWLHALSRNNA